QVVDEADRLIANTDTEAGQLIDWYDAEPHRVVTVPPGVDLDTFAPGDRQAARRRLGIRPDALVLLFVGRLQPLKAPDVLLRAAAALPAEVAERVEVVVVGAPSGSGLAEPDSLAKLAGKLGILDRVRFCPPTGRRKLAQY